MKCIIAGSRSIRGGNYVDKAMRLCPFTLDITEVLSGKAQGVDTLGERWAEKHGIPVKDFPAGWRDADGVLDRSAGHRRNEQMAVYAEALVAVWDGQSPGTADMIRRARKHRLEIFIFRV